MIGILQTINCFVYMYKLLKLICGKSHSVNKFPVIKAIVLINFHILKDNVGKFVEPF